MIDENYIVIQGWMVNKLRLSGNELIVYAVIYGFSQDGESKFDGSRQYLADCCNCSIRSIQNILNSLVEKELITKYEEEVNRVKVCKYVANFTPREKIAQGSEKIAHNNTIYNNINNNILSKDNIASKDSTTINDFEFGYSDDEKPKKKNLYQKCADLINEWTNVQSIKDLLFQYLNLCMEMQSIRGANQWKGMLNTLEKVQNQCPKHSYEEIIQASIEHGWKTFYPINDNYSKGNSEYIHIQKSNDYVQPTNEDLKPATNDDGSLKVF